MKKAFRKMDIWLLIIMLVFSGFGLLMIFSASNVTAVLRNNTTPTHYFTKQLITVVGAYLIGFIIILRIPTNLYKYLTSIAVILTISALVLVFYFGIMSNGAQSWYDFGSFNLQPAEFAKSVLIVYFGVYYYKLSQMKNPQFKNCLLPIAITGIMVFLVWRQPDFGGSIILIIIATLIFLAVPIPDKIKNQFKKLALLSVFVIMGIVLLYGAKVLNQNQLGRFNFMKPCSRFQESSGYQVCNGYIAINNGGVFGLGLGESTQKYLYLPEAHTDFIFPIIIEELGYITGIIVIIGYGFFLCRILIVAKNTSNIQNSVITYGCFILMTCHIFINLLGVLGLMPLTGVPLPFLSYGGSFGANTLGLLFIVLRISIENKTDQTKAEIKKI